MFPSARQMPLRNVDLGKQDPKSKLLVKTSTARRSSPAFLRPEQDVQYGEVCCEAALERSKLFSSTSKNLCGTSKMLRKWSDESLKSSSYFQTIFRSVCLDLLVDLLQTAESSKLKVLPSELGAGATGLTLGLVFWAFAQLLFLSVNHNKERNWTRN